MGNFKRVIVLLFLLLSFGIASADEIRIPFPVYVDEFKVELKESGLDFDGNKESIGFVEDKGSRIVLYTYKTIKIEDMESIKNIMWNHVRE